MCIFIQYEGFFLLKDVLGLMLEFRHAINMHDIIDMMKERKELGTGEIGNTWPFQEQIGHIKIGQELCLKGNSS